MVRSILTYGVSEAFARAANWLLLATLPLLATAEDYGLIALLVAVESLAAGVFIVGQDRAVLAKYAVAPSPGVFLSTVILGSIAVGGMLLAASLLLVSLLSDGRLLGLETFPDLLLLGTAVLLFNLNRIYLSVLRVESRPADYAIHRLTYGAVKAGLILFLAWQGLEHFAYIIGVLVAASVVLSLQGKDLHSRLSDRLDTDVLRDALGFGWPVVFHLISANVLMFIDRFMLGHFRDAAAVGVYSLGYTLGSSVVFVFAALAIHFEPLVYRQRDLGSRERVLAQYTGLCFGIASAGGAVLMLVLPLLIETVFPSEYVGGLLVAPIILAAHLIYPVYLQSNYRLSALGRTRSLALGSITAAVGNVLLNLLLIPRFGPVGAAWATAGSFLLLGGLMFLISLKKSSMRLADVESHWMLWFMLAASVLFVGLGGNLGVILMAVAAGVTLLGLRHKSRNERTPA